MINIHSYAQILVGIRQVYKTSKATFDDINHCNIKGQIEFKNSSDITEIQLLTLNASGSGFASCHSVAIYPIGDAYAILSISNLGGLIALNDVDNVVISGRTNRVSIFADLTLGFNHSNPVNILIQKSARFNQVKYCNIKVSSPNDSQVAINYSSNVEIFNANCFKKVSDNCLSYTNLNGGLQQVIC